MAVDETGRIVDATIVVRLSSEPVPPPSKTTWARVPSIGNRAVVQVYLRRLRNRVFSRKQHEKLHPLI